MPALFRLLGVAEWTSQAFACWLRCPKQDKPVPDGSYDLVIDLVGATPQSWGLLKRRGRMCQVDYGKMPGV